MKRATLLIALLLIPAAAAYGNESILFLHHSTGGNLYSQGGVSNWISTYNSQRGTSFSITERAYPNTPYPWANYPYDYWNLWINGVCDNANPNIECLDSLAANWDVIVWKHCFPGAAIQADTGTADVTSSRKSLENYKEQYRALRAEMDQYPDTQFIVWTLVPLHRLSTSTADAQRAAEFVNWTKNEWLTEDGQPHDNIALFDFWGSAAELSPSPAQGEQYTLRYEYERSHTSGDSHPNTQANVDIGPVFAQRIIDVLNATQTRPPPSLAFTQSAVSVNETDSFTIDINVTNPQGATSVSLNLTTDSRLHVTSVTSSEPLSCTYASTTSCTLTPTTPLTTNQTLFTATVHALAPGNATLSLSGLVNTTLVSDQTAVDIRALPRAPNTSGDANQDGVIDKNDLSFIIQNFRRAFSDARADRNFDGRVNLYDLVLIARTYVAPPAQYSFSGTPELPRVTVNTTYPSLPGTTVHVPAGGDLQAAINAASPGDTITLEAGATYDGPFTLPNKTGSEYIIIRTNATLPNRRIAPGDAPLLATVTSDLANLGAFRTASGAHHWRLVGVEIAAPSLSQTNALVEISGSTHPHHIVLDRVYVHGTPTQDLRRCVLGNGLYIAVVDSYLSECHSPGYDAQAFLSFDGKGPYLLENNYLEGSGENVMFCGAPPRSQADVPADITIRKNHFFKPLSWVAPDPWSVKNLFELKCGLRVLAEDNVFENNWDDSQVGFGMVWKDPDSPTINFTFRYNRVINNHQFVNIASQNYRLANFLIHDNVWERSGIDSDFQYGDHRGLQVLNDVENLHFIHNTLATSSNIMVMDGAPQASGIIIRDNVFASEGGYGVKGSGTGEGTVALNTFFSDWDFVGNALSGRNAGLYPPGNFFPADVASIGFVNRSNDLRLQPSSPLRGAATDGRDVGADVGLVYSRTAGVVQVFG